jgi:hypothetical protein
MEEPISQEKIDNTILNLKIISKIKENDKLNSNKDIIEINQPHILQGIERWYFNESRGVTIEKLNKICENTFEITDELLENEKMNNCNSVINMTNSKKIHLNENNNQIFQSFIYEMTNSLLGLENLKKTYSNDILISSQLDLILKKMNTRIEKMSKLISIKID